MVNLGNFLHNISVGVCGCVGKWTGCVWLCGHVGKCRYMGGGAGWFGYVLGSVKLNKLWGFVQQRTPILPSISSVLCIYSHT